MVHFPLLVSLNISKEEELSENVKDLPVLCDKVLEGFKEKDTAKNPWCDIARALEFALNDNYVWFYTFNCNFLKMASLNQFCENIYYEFGLTPLFILVTLTISLSCNKKQEKRLSN